jgi:hypothetical protein
MIGDMRRFEEEMEYWKDVMGKRRYFVWGFPAWYDFYDGTTENALGF